MSYGWLTESSFVPKPGKEIHDVSPQSLVSLRTLVVEGEEASRRRVEASGVKRTRPTKKFRSGIERLMDSSNPGVQDRSASDNRTQSDATHNSALDVFEMSAKKLKEKEKLYNALVDGSIDPERLVDHVGIPNNAQTFKGKERALCLDVKRKREELAASQDGSSNGKCSSPPPESDTVTSVTNSLIKDQLKERLSRLRSANKLIEDFPP